MRYLMAVCVLSVGLVLFLQGTRSAMEPAEYQNATLLEARSVGGEEGFGAPCYRITVQIRDILYVTEQCSTFYWNSYAPHEFVENGDIQVRFEKDKMFLKRPNGKELRTRVLRRIKVVREDGSSRRSASGRESSAGEATPAIQAGH